MFTIIGVIVVFASVIGGYLLEKGNLAVLVQPAEYIIILGAALGAMLITCTPSLFFQILRAIAGIFSSSKNDKLYFLQVLDLLYNIFSKVKKEGFISIDKDIEGPEESPLFNKYDKVASDHHLIRFICENLRVMVILGSSTTPNTFEEVMEVEIDVHHSEKELISGTILKISDSLPGFGIVAAVMGVVITMGKMGESPEVIGHSVGAALVGTFFGILLCYGVLSPIGNNLEIRAKADSKVLDVVKACISAFAKDMPPLMAVEFGRRVISSEFRPSFKELETTLRGEK